MAVQVSGRVHVVVCGEVRCGAGCVLRGVNDLTMSAGSVELTPVGKNTAPTGPRPGTESKMRREAPATGRFGRGKNFVLLGFVLLFGFLLLNRYFFESDRGTIEVLSDGRFKLSRSDSSNEHERRLLRLVLAKNSSYTFAETIDQEVSTSIMGKEVGEQKQKIYMEFVLHVDNIKSDGAEVTVTCKKFEIVSFDDDGKPYKAHLWETMEAVVAGSSFSAFLGNNGTLLKSDTAHIHKKVFEELHKLDALPMELNAILTIPRDAASDVESLEESVNCLGTRFVNRPSGTVKAPMVLAQPRTACECAPPIGSTGHRWSGAHCRLKNDVAGKIVVMIRGECNFEDKLILAQDSGAVGVVLGDTEDRELVFMGGKSEKVYLPAVMVQKVDYDRIVKHIMRADDASEEYVGTLRHGLDAFQYDNKTPNDAIDDLLGYNYLLEDQLKKRLTIFPNEPVGRGDSWERTVQTDTPVPHENYEKYTMEGIFKKVIGENYRWIARVKVETKESPLLTRAPRQSSAQSKEKRPPLISSASSHNLKGGESGVYDIDVVSGLVLHGEVEQKISGSHSQSGPSAPPVGNARSDSSFPEPTVVKIDTSISAHSFLCTTTVAFGDCSQVIKPDKGSGRRTFAMQLRSRALVNARTSDDGEKQRQQTMHMMKHVY